MKVLVTGANGMLGQDLCPYLEELGIMVVPTDYDTMDITDSIQTEEVISRVHPDLIIHCAAYTNVDKAEDELDFAYLLNSQAVENLALVAKESGTLLIHISTDYVFSGESSTPYTEEDDTCPIGIYGKTKCA